MKILTDIDLSPEIQKYLPLIDEKYLFYKEHSLKHPSAIYNVSIRKIEDALTEFFKAYILLETNTIEEFEKAEKQAINDILRSYKDFLYSVREHIDDCLHILKILTEPKSEYKNLRNQYDWLKTNVPDRVQDFFTRLADYKKYTDDIVNELKHNNGILCSVGFYKSTDPSKHCFGYFVANVIDSIYSPVEKIHPKFKTVYTAFSFKRDINYNLYNVHYLSKLLIYFLKDKIGIDIRLLNPKVEQAPINKQKLYENIFNIENIFFPDEYTKPVPKFIFNSDKTLKLQYPSNASVMPNLLDRVVVTHSPDGHTGGFRIPYM